MADDVKQTETSDPIAVKPMWYWVKDSKGNGSVTTTLLFISFWVTTIAYIASIFENIGPVTFRQFDVAASGSYFGLLLMLYFGRRYTEAKFRGQEK